MRHCFITGKDFGMGELKAIAKLDKDKSPYISVVGDKCSVVILTEKPFEQVQKTVKRINESFPPKGEWVDIDLSKVTLADLPIKARFRDYDNREWIESKLNGFSIRNGASGLPYESKEEWFRFCQVWRPL